MKKKVLCLGIATSLLALALTSTAAAQTGPQQECFGAGEYSVQKMPLFGDLHSHTSWSFDAVTLGTRTTPAEAYSFAKRSQQIDLPPYEDGVPQRYQWHKEPLDFLAVTDHSEYFGEVRLCLPEGGQTEIGTGPFPDTLACSTMQGAVAAVSGNSASDGGAFKGSDDLSDKGFMVWGLNAMRPDPRRFPFCDRRISPNCAGATSLVWGEVQHAANQAYEPCEFTSFIGYEWTSMPQGYNHHRNVIFKNEYVPSTVFSTFETGSGGYDLPNDGAPVLWELLEQNCTGTGTSTPLGGNCDVLAIPHNANVSGGNMMPVFKASGEVHRQRQMKFETLMEIHQTKGNSECRWGVGNTDEDCQFELLSKKFLFGGDRPMGPVDYEDINPGSDFLTADQQGYGEIDPDQFGDLMTDLGGTYNYFQREILKGGLWLAQDPAYAGANPFKLGVVGGTDTHISAAGSTEETAPKGDDAFQGFQGHHGREDQTPRLRLSMAEDFNDDGLDDDDLLANDIPADPKHSFLESNPGGLTVVWATENTRDAIFYGLKKRETYATSGNRPTVRFFGSWATDAQDDFGGFDGACSATNDTDFATIGYAQGVPMGLGFSDLTMSKPSNPRPVFAIRAERDLDPDVGDIQRLQVIKGWVEDVDGVPTPKEKVITVISDTGQLDPATGTVNPATGSLEPPVANEYIDSQTCTFVDTAPSEPHLCMVWKDDEFDESQNAFYYVRVLESPTCRWSTRECIALEKAEGGAPHECWTELETHANANNVPGNGDGDDKIEGPGVTVPLTIQERAWTSPIWYDAGS